MTSPPPTLNVDPVFRAKPFVFLQIAGALAGGFFLYAIVAVFFIVGINTPPTPGHGNSPTDDPTFIPMIGCSVIGGFSLIAAFFLLRSSRAVTLTRDFLVVHSFLSRRQLRWTDIGSVNREKKKDVVGFLTFASLEVQNRAGKTKLVITNTIADFDTLADVITTRIGALAGPEATDESRAEERRLAKDSRKRRLLAFVFLLFTLGATAGFIFGLYELSHTRRYATEGVRVDATIQRAYVYRVTPRVEYSFQDATGRTFSREAGMFVGPEWDKVQNSKTIPVIYLPSDPNWNRLVAGEEDAGLDNTFLLTTAGGILMFGFCFIICLLGYDLRTEDGATRLLRRGVVIKQWGGKR